MRTMHKTLIAAAMSATLLSAPCSWAQQTPATAPPAASAAGNPSDDEVQPRFIWGILINFAISKISSFAWDIFAGYLQTKLSAGLIGSADAITSQLIANLVGNSGARLRPRSSGAIAARGPDIVVGTPETPLSITGGKENYQGAHVALLMASPDGKTFSVRSVGDGFMSGERFKLRIVSTFGGDLTIENINPADERRTIYPAGADQVVSLQAGKETVVPLNADQFFEFTRTTGREQLVVNLADPRAVGAAASTNKVFRQDLKYGSNFLQEVTPNSFAHISQAVELQHNAR